jgi:hypothetical protein
MNSSVIAMKVKLGRWHRYNDDAYREHGDGALLMAPASVSPRHWALEKVPVASLRPIAERRPNRR